MQSHHKTGFNKAFSLHQKGNFTEAADIYRGLICDGSESADLFHLYGLALHQTGKNEDALLYIKKAVSISPDSTVYLQNLAIVYRDLGNQKEVVNLYREILKINPDHLEAHRNLALYLRSFREHEEALIHGRRALKIDPNHSATWNNMGNLFNDLGQIDEAHEHYQKSVKLSPCYGQAWANLSTVTKYRDDSDIRKMETILASRDLPPTEAGQMCFALGKAYKDLGRPDDAFPYYVRANKSVSSSFPWERFESYLEDIKDAFSHEFFDCRKYIDSDVSPIFIVGMIRSGTSLAEQILSSHPEICGVGERPELANLTQLIENYPRGVPGATHHRLSKIAKQYVDAINQFKNSRFRSADKMMTNYLHIGIISLLFPHARIVHMKRNPYAVGLSIFCQNFSKPPGWTSSLDDIGRYYANYHGMMNHWESHSPIKIHTVVYEELLSDPERVTRNLFAYCGEKWTADCLNFHKNRNVVQTASNWQVRQPLNRKNGEKWRAFEPFLSDLDKWLPSSKQRC